MTDLPPGWEWTTLGEVAETTLGKMLDRGKTAGFPAVPYVRNVNIQWRFVDLSDVLTMELPPSQLEQFKLEPGDLLVCEGGEIGRCAIWPGGDEYMAFQKAVHRVRTGPRVLVEFLAYVIEDSVLSGRILDLATGSTIKHLPQVQLRRLPFALPSIEEQVSICSALDSVFEGIDEGERLLKRALSRVSELPTRFAVLSKAGDLRRQVLSEALREWGE